MQIASLELPEATYRECDVNAEDCRIKAEQTPHLRTVYLDQARFWESLAEEYDQ